MRKYNAYKPSGIEWIGDIPEKWETIKLKFLTSYNDDSLAEKTNDSHIINYVEISDVNCSDGVVNTTEYAFKDAPSRARRITKKNDVIISTVRTYLKAIAKINEDGLIVSTGFIVLRPQKIYNQFLSYSALSESFISDVISQSVGVSYPAIKASQIVNIKIPIPSYAEQVAIASYLEAKCAKIDNVLSVQQKRIELLKELKQSIVSDAVTKGLDKNVELKPSGVEWIGDIPEKWKLMKLKYICKDEKYSIKTGPFGSQLKGEDLREEGDVRVYNQRNVIDDCFDDVQFYVTSAKAKDLQSFFTKENDLLVTSRGTIGRCSILPKIAPMGVLHPCLIALRINEKKCSLQWAKFFINESDCFKTNVFLNSNATTIEVIYTDTLKSIFIPLPPLKEQLTIISYLEHRCSAIDTQISKIERQIELLKEYKQSIITECVTGKRKVC